VGIFSLEHARQEEKEREREVASGQRETIFTAAAAERRLQKEHARHVMEQQQDDGRASVTTALPAATTTTASSLHPHVLSTGHVIGQSGLRTVMPEERSRPLAREHGVAEAEVPLASQPLNSGSQDVMFDERAVILGMELDIEETDPVSPGAFREDELPMRVGGENAGLKDRSSGVETRDQQGEIEGAGGGGFLSGFVHGVEEAIYDAGDVVQKYVPESVGEHLRESFCW
jgi:hypothetical protein